MNANYEARRRLLPLLRRLPEPLEARVRGLLRTARTDETPPHAELAYSERPGGEHAEMPGVSRRSVRGDSVVVLLYHRVAEDLNDPFRLSVGPQRFEEHMRIVKRHAEPVTLAEVLKRGQRPRVAVTFDDGYADNLLAGGPILEAASMPATVFVTSGAVGSQRPLWPLRLEELFRLGEPRADLIELDVAGNALSVGTPRGGRSTEAMMAVHDLLTPLHPSATAEAMKQLEDHFGGDVSTGCRRMLSELEVRAMAATDIFTVGSHTRSHAWLSALDDTELDHEIAGSKADLESITGRPIADFAYPFGTRISFGRGVTRAVRRAGFALACTTFDDPVAPGTGRYLVPRRPVHDWNGPQFEGRLLSWLAA